MDCYRLDDTLPDFDRGELFVLALLQPSGPLLFFRMDSCPRWFWYIRNDGYGLPAAQYVHRLCTPDRANSADYSVFFCPGRSHQTGSGPGAELEPPGAV